MGKGEKAKLDLTVPSLPTFLRDLAAALEGEKSAEISVSLQGYTEIKLTAEPVGEAVKIKLKAKLGAAGTDTAETGGTKGDKGSYKDLKKSMKKSFGDIADALASGILPEEGTVLSFLDEARKMVTFPGYGDEYYTDFTAATDAMAAAWESRDPARLQESWREMDRLKSECHDRYK